MNNVKRIVLIAVLACVPLPVEAARKIHYTREHCPPELSYCDYNIYRANLTGNNLQIGHVGLWPSVRYAPHVDTSVIPGRIFTGYGISSPSVVGYIVMRYGNSDSVTLKAGGPPITALALKPGTPILDLYYATDNPVEIRRMALDGSGDVGRFTPPGGRVNDLAFRGPMLYWTNATGIHRSDILGFAHTLIQGGDKSTYGLDVDSTHIYYGSHFFSGLRRMKLDGSGVTTIVSTEPAAMGYPRLDGLGKVYWIDARNDRVQRANLDGSDVETIISEPGYNLVPWNLSMEIGPWSCEPTGKYGDLVSPFGGSAQPDFKDIRKTVECFLDNCSELEYDQADTEPCWNSTQCAGNGVVDFKDIAQIVKLFQAFSPCP